MTYYKPYHTAVDSKTVETTRMFVDPSIEAHFQSDGARLDFASEANLNKDKAYLRTLMGNATVGAKIKAGTKFTILALFTKGMQKEGEALLDDPRFATGMLTEGNVPYEDLLTANGLHDARDKEVKPCPAPGDLLDKLLARAFPFRKFRMMCSLVAVKHDLKLAKDNVSSELCLMLDQFRDFFENEKLYKSKRPEIELYSQSLYDTSKKSARAQANKLAKKNKEEDDADMSGKIDSNIFTTNTLISNIKTNLPLPLPETDSSSMDPLALEDMDAMPKTPVPANTEDYFVSDFPKHNDMALDNADDVAGKPSGLPPINILFKSFNHQLIQSRGTNNDTCLNCSQSYSKTLSHININVCSNCHGNIYSCCLNHTGYECFLNQALYHHLAMMSPSERFNILSEYQADTGDWRCLYCNTNCTQAWSSERPHGLIEATLGIYIPGCVSFGSVASQIMHSLESVSTVIPHNNPLPLPNFATQHNSTSTSSPTSTLQYLSNRLDSNDFNTLTCQILPPPRLTRSTTTSTIPTTPTNPTATQFISKGEGDSLKRSDHSDNFNVINQYGHYNKNSFSKANSVGTNNNSHNNNNYQMANQLLPDHNKLQQDREYKTNHTPYKSHSSNPIQRMENFPQLNHLQQQHYNTREWQSKREQYEIISSNKGESNDKSIGINPPLKHSQSIRQPQSESTHHPSCQPTNIAYSNLSHEKDEQDEYEMRRQQNEAKKYNDNMTMLRLHYAQQHNSQTTNDRRINVPHTITHSSTLKPVTNPANLGYWNPPKGDDDLNEDEGTKQQNKVRNYNENMQKSRIRYSEQQNNTQIMNDKIHYVPDIETQPSTPERLLNRPYSISTQNNNKPSGMEGPSGFNPLYRQRINMQTEETPQLNSQTYEIPKGRNTDGLPKQSTHSKLQEDSNDTGHPLTKFHYQDEPDSYMPPEEYSTSKYELRSKRQHGNNTNDRSNISSYLDNDRMQLNGDYNEVYTYQRSSKGQDNVGGIPSHLYKMNKTQQAMPLSNQKYAEDSSNDEEDLRSRRYPHEDHKNHDQQRHLDKTGSANKYHGKQYIQMIANDSKEDDRNASSIKTYHAESQIPQNRMNSRIIWNPPLVNKSVGNHSVATDDIESYTFSKRFNDKLKINSAYHNYFQYQQSDSDSDAQSDSGKIRGEKTKLQTDRNRPDQSSSKSIWENQVHDKENTPPTDFENRNKKSAHINISRGFISTRNDIEPTLQLKRQETQQFLGPHPSFRPFGTDLQNTGPQTADTTKLVGPQTTSRGILKDITNQISQNNQIFGTNLDGNIPIMDQSQTINFEQSGHNGNYPSQQVPHTNSTISTSTTNTEESSVQSVAPQGLSPGIYSIGTDNTVTFTPPQPTVTANNTIPLSLLQTLSSHAQQNSAISQMSNDLQLQRVNIKQEKGVENPTANFMEHKVKQEKTTQNRKEPDDDPSDSSDSESSTSSSSTDENKHKRNKKKDKQNKSKKGKKSRRHNDASSSDSENESSSSSEDEKPAALKNTLFSLLQTMTCDSEYADELALLKTLFTRRSELPELKRTKGYYTPKLTDFFPEIYKGNAKRLKRYLIRLLEYSAIKAGSHRERADLISEGPGLSDECIKDLEMATKIPLPGLGDTYTDSKLSQKKRLLDLLLTFVILFYKDEPISALQDLKLRGPFYSGLTKLYQSITSGSTQLPPKLIEEYLARAILRTEGGDGMALLTNFQSQLRLQKRFDSSYTTDENKHRRLIYNCCAILTNEYTTLNNNGQIKEQNTRSLQQQRPSGDQYQRFPNTQYRDQNVPQSQGQYREPYPRSQQQQGRDPYPRSSQSQYRDQYPRSQQPYRENYSQNHTQQQYNRRSNVENTHFSDIIDQDDLIMEYTNMVLDNRVEDNSGVDNEQTKQDKIITFQRIFMTKPCRCCGSPNHTMLSNEKSNDGRNYTEYKCPASLCEKWADARFSMIKNLKYQISPEKFARMCKFDSNQVMEAWKHYSNDGSGKFKKPGELSSLRQSVLSFCKSPNGTRSQDHRSASLSLRIVPRERKYNISSVFTKQNTSATVVSIHSGDPYSKGTNLCGSLHLLVATKVEPATVDEIENLHSTDTNYLESLYRTEYRSLDDPEALRVKLLLPNGESFIVPYREIQGRILPDTGSTTSLINEDFAISKGLYIEESPHEIILRDVNNGERTIQHRCYLRLTITSVTGREVVTILPALCVPNLSHEILLGTKDLERYQVSVIPHLGQAKMTIGYEEMVFPMMDEVSISELQNNLRTLNGTRNEC